MFISQLYLHHSYIFSVDIILKGHRCVSIAFSLVINMMRVKYLEELWCVVCMSSALKWLMPSGNIHCKHDTLYKIPFFVCEYIQHFTHILLWRIEILSNLLAQSLLCIFCWITASSKTINMLGIYHIIFQNENMKRKEQNFCHFTVHNHKFRQMLPFRIQPFKYADFQLFQEYKNRKAYHYFWHCYSIREIL